MDDQDKALNDEVEAETTEDTTPVSEETTTDDSTSEDESQKKGFSARVRELNAEKKAAEEKAARAEAQANSLAETVAALTGGVPQGGQVPFNNAPLKPLIEPGEEVTAEELNRRQEEREQALLDRASRMNDLNTQRIVAMDRVNREAKELTRKYEELNPNSDDFDPELSDTVTEAALAYVRANPTKSLEEFVDKQMKVHKRAVTKEAKAEQAEIAKQSSQAGSRPSTTKPADKKFEDLSIEEMEAKLGYYRG